ncbi:MAG: SDR family NAD(P)-dependent oxidoreductase [Granulosicoccus sp.]
MKLDEKTIIVTGAAQGIGAAIATRFAAEGANVVVADINPSAAEKVAEGFGGIGVACDVTIEADVQALVASAEAHYGAVDLFCSNAGACFGEPSHSASASNDDWNRSWDIHVMAHVYAARAVLPSMIERGDGYLLQMSSAAGLLSQIGNAAYSATKHAAIGFAESLAITHAEDGIKVSVICPQYVSTPMLGYTQDSIIENLPGVLTPEEVANKVLQGVEKESFLILPHPDVAQFVQFKSANYDKWLAAMRKLRSRVIDETGSTDLEAMHKLV